MTKYDVSGIAWYYKNYEIRFKNIETVSISSLTDEIDMDQIYE